MAKSSPAKKTKTATATRTRTAVVLEPTKVFVVAGLGGVLYAMAFLMIQDLLR